MRTVVFFTLSALIGLTGCSKPEQPPSAQPATHQATDIASLVKQSGSPLTREVAFTIQLTAPYTFTDVHYYAFTGRGEFLGKKEQVVDGFSRSFNAAYTIDNDEQDVFIAFQMVGGRIQDEDTGELTCLLKAPARDHFEPLLVDCNAGTTATHLIASMMMGQAEKPSHPFDWRTIRTWKTIDDHTDNVGIKDIVPLVALMHTYIGKLPGAGLHQKHAPHFGKTLEATRTLLSAYAVERSIDHIRFTSAIRQTLALMTIDPAKELLSDENNILLDSIAGIKGADIRVVRLFLEGSKYLDLSDNRAVQVQQVNIDREQSLITWTPVPWANAYHVFIDEYLASATDDYSVSVEIPSQSKQVKITAIGPTGEYTPLVLNRKTESLEHAESPVVSSNETKDKSE